MNLRRHWYLAIGLALLLLLLLLGGLAIYLSGGLQSYETTIEHGPTPEVRHNPYLAAQLFLVEQGRTVTRSEGFAGVPAQGEVLLLLGERTAMTPTQAQRVLEWAGNGGHLVFVAERLWDENSASSGDLLLDALNLQQHLTSDHLPADEAARAIGIKDQPQLTRLYLENEHAPVYLAFDTDYHLYDTGQRAHAWANSAGATHMLQLQHGEGLITALTDSWIWQNDRIKEYDHAWLLWYLTQDRAVTLVYRGEHDGLATQLLRHFPEALASLALMLLLAIWHFAQRQGPLLPTTDRARRQLEEHLRACAGFLYRYGGPSQLLGILQQDIQRRARQRHPGFEELTVAEQHRVLATLSRFPLPTIEQVLRAIPAKTSASDFTRQVAHLQRIRNAL